MKGYYDLTEAKTKSKKMQCYNPKDMKTDLQ